MPHASSKTVIDAPFARVSQLLIDKMEIPKKYVGTILWSKVTERGDGYLMREMYEPKPSDLLIREKIYHHPVDNGEEFVYEHVGNARYTGQFRNILTRIDAKSDQCVLEYRMEWTPHPGTQEQIDDVTANRMVNAGIAHMKELAEHPVEVPAWVTAFYAAIDGMKPDAIGPMLADNVRFRFGSGNDVLGRERVLQVNRDVLSHMKSMKHHFVEVYHDRAKTFVEALVDYELPNGASYQLPFLTMFDRKDERIVGVKIYGDISPLHHGWPT